MDAILKFIMDSSIYFWLVLVIVFILIEAFTMDLTSIWFGVSSLLTMALAYFKVDIYAQFIFFAICAGILLFFARPLAKKLLLPKPASTNADRIIGATGLVTEKIDIVNGKGQIKVLGQVWSAKSQNGEDIGANTSVKILEIQGVKAIVEEIKTL